MDQMTNREMEDARMVEAAFKHLIDTYLKSRHRKHTEIIEKAFNFARQAHKGVRRLRVGSGVSVACGRVVFTGHILWSQ